jgi:hypothetical protein
LIPVGPAPGAISSQEEDDQNGGDGEPDMMPTISKDKLDMILSVLEKLKAGALPEDLARDIVAKIDPTFDLAKIVGPEEKESEPKPEPMPPQLKVPPVEPEEEEEKPGTE